MSKVGTWPPAGVPGDLAPPPQAGSQPRRGGPAGRADGGRLLFTALGVLGVAGLWLAALTGDVDLAAFVAVATALAAAPFVVYGAFIHTRAASVAVGAALAAVTFGLPAGFAGRSSVVPGLLAALPLAWLVVGLGVAYDRRVTARRPPVTAARR